MPKLKEEQEETAEVGSEEIKEGEMPKLALDALKKHQDKKEDKSEKSEEKSDEKKDEKEEVTVTR